MPYEISFTRKVAITDRERYFNDCCVGGDVVADQLLPALRARYEEIQSDQEDWGWFIWFRAGPVRLAADIVTYDPESGGFRVRLTSRRKRWLVLETLVDTPELEELRELVASELAAWVGHPVRTTRLDRKEI